MSLTRFFLFALVTVLACGHPPVSPPIPALDPAEISYSVFLIGDAGCRLGTTRSRRRLHAI